MSLYKKIETIETKEDLADFVEKLRLSLDISPSDWQNQSLEKFLEAMAAWIKVIDIYSNNEGDKAIKNPSWNTFAKILYAAKIYE